LEDVCRYLQNKETKNTKSYCGENYAIKEYITNDHHIVCIWKTFTYFDFWYRDFTFTTNDDLIAVVDYYFVEDSLKIENFTVNDFDYALKKKHFHYLNLNDAQQIRTSILSYLINIAAIHVKNNIIIELQHDARAYITSYMDYGFKIVNITPLSFHIKYSLLKNCRTSYYDLSANQRLIMEI